MKAVLVTTDRALVESVRLELEGQGIAAVIQNDAGTAMPFFPVRILVPDGDAPRADAIVDLLRPPRLQLTPAEPPKRSRTLLLVVTLAAAAILLRQLLWP